MRQALLTVFSCLVALTGAPPAGSAQETPRLSIHGNRVLVDEVYRAAVPVPDGALLDAATAAGMQAGIHSFLVRSGYALGRVSVRPADGKLRADVDEGQVGKIVIIGRGSYHTLRLKLALEVHARVFNQPALDRQLLRLGRVHGFQGWSWRLVPAGPAEAVGPQLDFLAERIPGLPPAAPYDLHIILGKGGWGTGLGFEMDYGGPDGLVTGVTWRSRGLLLDDARWQLGAVLGLDLRESLVDQATDLVMTRAEAEVRWYTPALFGVEFRPWLGLRNTVIERQRRDLELDRYRSEHLETSLNLRYELIEGLAVSLGGGMRGRSIFDLRRVPLEEGEAPRADLSEPLRLNGFLQGRVGVVFDPQVPRVDRRHELSLDLRYDWGEERGDWWQIGASYQKIFRFGWHDLLLHGGGFWKGGDVAFDGETSVGGRYLRGVFGGAWFVREAAGARAEFRLSLVRDLFKISVFNDVAVFGEIDRSGGPREVRIADSVGAGFHALILDMFQLDVYYGFGFASDGAFDYGLVTTLRKVF